MSRRQRKAKELAAAPSTTVKAGDPPQPRNALARESVAAHQPHRFSKLPQDVPEHQRWTRWGVYWRLTKLGLVITLLVVLLWLFLDIGGNVLAGSQHQSVVLGWLGRLWETVQPREVREPLAINKTPPPGPAPKGMAWVPGGWFWMGAENLDGVPPHHLADCPVHKVYVDGFWMDKTEVTNEQWLEFVEATGYKTVAEKAPDPSQFPPHTPREELAKLKPFSLVFDPPPFVRNLQDHRQWWRLQEGANWRSPEGPGSDIQKRMNHPVVHIAWVDAVEYCKWRSQKEGATYRLPTEAEWEFAARGGLDQKKYVWGDELKPGGKCQANYWQGQFPNQNTLEDGYERTAPVASYPPNGYGLYDMAGNVWEWCLDNYGQDYYLESPLKNPMGPRAGIDPNEPEAPKRVQRGGSFLCADNYCMRYLPATRGKGDIWSAANHIGFRCIRVVEVEAKKE